MKKILLSFIISLHAYLSLGQSILPPQPCSDLFFSELTFGKVPEGGTFDLNYAVEIFNPTEDTLNLENYSLELTNSIGVVDTIFLHGPIFPGDVYVVTNGDADTNLLNLADTLTYNLDFEANVVLKLMHNKTVIDRIGQLGTPSSGSIDVVQLFADPYNYLLNFHIDLNDYENIDIRRSVFVDMGNPSFIDSSSDVLNKWYYYFNFDRSDIGKHISVCNKTEGINFVQYMHPLLNDLYLPNTISPLTMQFTGGSAPYADMVNTIVPSGTTAIFNTSNSGYMARFQQPSNYALDAGTCNSLTTGVINCESIYYTNNNFSGIKTVELILSSTDPDIVVVGNNQIVNLHGAPTSVGVEIISEGVKIWPSITSNYVHIETSIYSDFKIYSINGASIYSGIVLNGVNSIYFGDLPRGLYFIKLFGKENSSVYKITKE
jgi:hypothetical protein